MKIVARFEKGTFWNNNDGYRIISSTHPNYPENTKFDYSKAMYEAEQNRFTLELTLIH